MQSHFDLILLPALITGTLFTALAVVAWWQRNTGEIEERVAEHTAKLQAAIERLQALNRLKDEFVSNVCHELRTPISSILLYLDLLKNDPKRSEVYLDRLQRETTRLMKIIEGLLLLSHLDQEHETADLRPLDLSRLSSEYVSDRIPLAESKGLTLAFENDGQIPPVCADAELFIQALGAVLTNAVNYTPAGGYVVVNTRASKYYGSHWVGVEVSDSGPGIAAEEQARIFERFYRGKAGRDAGELGTGLGLAIAREIMERHHGRIEVESQGIPGMGATFGLWLPVSE